MMACTRNTGINAIGLPTIFRAGVAAGGGAVNFRATVKAGRSTSTANTIAGTIVGTGASTENTIAGTVAVTTACNIGKAN